jgi:hypothetical protein
MADRRQPPAKAGEVAPDLSAVGDKPQRQFRFEIRIGDDQTADLSELAGDGDPNPLQRCVMPLLSARVASGHLTSLQPLGTAFCLVPGFALTAKHNLDPVSQPRERVGQSGGPAPTNTEYIYVAFEAGPGPSGLLPVDNVSINTAHDLALLRFRFPEGWGERFMGIPLTFHAPKRGSSVLALGYPGTSTSRDGDDYHVHRRLVAAQGTVEQVQFPQRSAMVHFPVIAGDFPAPHGMSGGPVLSETSGICGMVCTGLDPAENSGCTSTASLLPFILGFSFEAEFQGEHRVWSTKELIKRGAIRTDGSEDQVEVREIGSPPDSLSVDFQHALPPD